MSGEKRAPGPFDLHFGHDYVRVLKACGTTDDVVAEVYGDTADQLRATAYLFYGAPDLLAAMLEAADILGDLPPRDNVIEALKTARAAIAKARGL